ncbi:hypothetical protein OMAG_000309 [Candidatus Omnitrophus magneticus]|uniref:Uncharacterized protein n=1 Tax=Candidatus Omnitrophus magneticus TaxID=1609969 RepID=A0A0F0CUY4_9BACT|nr:hypothetical protein OMAG_000309 [Candidatus Omnitrophus magneticus]
MALRSYARGGEIGLKALFELYKVLNGSEYKNNTNFNIENYEEFKKIAQAIVLSLPSSFKEDVYKTNRLLLKILLSA